MNKLRKILREINNAHVSNYARIARAEYDVILDEYIDPIYWYEDIQFDFGFPYKFEISQPYLHLSLPAGRLGLENTDAYDSESLIAIEDFILRTIEPLVTEKSAEYRNKNKETAETGAIYVQHPSQEVVKRNSVSMAGDTVIITLKTVLPIHHNGTVNGKKASAILTKDIPESLDRLIADFDSAACLLWRKTAEMQRGLRVFLKDNGLVSFVANGSILPREKNSDLPLATAIPFVSTKEDEVEIIVSGSAIRGMGIKKGITVITGGGYSGKSTLLDAIEYGIYNHIPGDGREFVVTDETAIKAYAEDGRPVSDLDLSPFIKYLPMGGDSSSFTTSTPAAARPRRRTSSKPSMPEQERY